MPETKQPNHWQVYLSIACLGLIAVGVVVMVVLHKGKPEQQYYSYDANKKTNRLYSLSRPNVSTASLLRWAANAASAANTLDFYNYDQTLRDLRQYFTEAGYTNFLAALEQANTISEITSKRIIQSAVVTGMPVVVRDGLIKGEQSWVVQMPMLFTYQGPSRDYKKRYVVTLLITEMATTAAPKGIGIAQYLISTQQSGKT